MDEEEAGNYLSEMAEKDKVEERFRVIAENEKISKLDAWTVKIVGDN